MNGRQRYLGLLDNLLALILIAMVLGTTLAFGGRVPWAKPLIGSLAALWVLGLSGRMMLVGTWQILKSPLTGLGMLAVLLAIVQIVPLPASIAARISPKAAEVYSTGILPTPASIDDPQREPIAGASTRSPSSIDRSATLRWTFGATLCIGVFWGVSHYTDRQSRLYLVWGILLAALGINSVLAVIQLTTGANGLYGFIQPGGGHLWDPTQADLLNAPGASVLRAIASPGEIGSSWALPRPDRVFLIGTTLGGSGAFLGLAALGLPLSLALSLQILAPRGSRETLSSRLSVRGHGGLFVVLLALLLVAGILTGVFAGRWLVIPFAASLAIAGLPAMGTRGLRWSGLVLTTFAVASLCLGVAIGRSSWIEPGMKTLTESGSFSDLQASWGVTARVIRDYPLTGVGLGGFSAIEPFYKRQDASWSTSSSSVLQWCAESGVAGMGLLLIAICWGLWRLPGSIQRVGRADRSLAFGMLGAAVGFGVLSTLQWTMELPSLALSASALGGTYNRWLAGGTDLFVEHS